MRCTVFTVGTQIPRVLLPHCSLAATGGSLLEDRDFFRLREEQLQIDGSVVAWLHFEGGAMKMSASYLWAGCAVTVLGCTAREELVPKDLATAIETCMARDDPKGCAALYTEDAEIIQAGYETVRGRSAILQFYKEQIAPDLALYTDSDVNLAKQDLGVEEGTYRIRNLSSRADVEDGHYLNVLKKRNGEWKIFRSFYVPHRAPRSGVEVSPGSG
jgi:hypothetical protein